MTITNTSGKTVIVSGLSANRVFNSYSSAETSEIYNLVLHDPERIRLTITGPGKRI